MKQKRHLGKIISIVVILIFLSLVAVSVPTIISKRKINPEAANLFVAITKDRPNISVQNIASETQLSDVIQISIKCNAFYESVKLKLVIYDKNDQILSTYYYDEANYNYGETYKINYIMETSEILYSSRFGVTLISYN